jgi:hypothetical protein
MPNGRATRVRPARVARAVRRRLSRKPVAHFLHLPKTGGTAIRAALVGQELSGSYRLHLAYHGLTFDEVPRGEKVFFAVRDPASRFVSGFYSRQRKGQPRYLIEWTEAEAAVFERFSTPNDLAEALSDPRQETADAARAAMSAVRHFHLQSHWVRPAAAVERSDDILASLSQSRLDADFAALCAVLQVSASLPHDDVAAHRNPAAVDRRLSDRATANLRDWYAEDYELLDVLARRTGGAR